MSDTWAVEASSGPGGLEASSAGGPTGGAPLVLKTPLPCWHESVASARTDRLVVLSEQGAFIATDRPVPAGTPLFLELSLGTTFGAARAEIDAVASDDEALRGSGLAGFAVRFLELDAEVRRWIQRHLEAERERDGHGKSWVTSVPEGPAEMPPPTPPGPAAESALRAVPAPLRTPPPIPVDDGPDAEGFDPFATKTPVPGPAPEPSELIVPRSLEGAPADDLRASAAEARSAPALEVDVLDLDGADALPVEEVQLESDAPELQPMGAGNAAPPVAAALEEPHVEEVALEDEAVDVEEAAPAAPATIVEERFDEYADLLAPAAAAAPEASPAEDPWGPPIDFEEEKPVDAPLAGLFDGAFPDAPAPAEPRWSTMAEEMAEEDKPTDVVRIADVTATTAEESFDDEDVGGPAPHSLAAAATEEIDIDDVRARAEAEEALRAPAPPRHAPAAFYDDFSRPGPPAPMPPPSSSAPAPSPLPAFVPAQPPPTGVRAPTVSLYRSDLFAEANPTAEVAAPPAPAAPRHQTQVLFHADVMAGIEEALASPPAVAAPQAAADPSTTSAPTLDLPALERATKAAAAPTGKAVPRMPTLLLDAGELRREMTLRMGAAPAAQAPQPAAPGPLPAFAPEGIESTTRMGSAPGPTKPAAPAPEMTMKMGSAPSAAPAPEMTMKMGSAPSLPSASIPASFGDDRAERTMKMGSAPGPFAASPPPARPVDDPFPFTMATPSPVASGANASGWEVEEPALDDELDALPVVVGTSTLIEEPARPQEGGAAGAFEPEAWIVGAPPKKP